MDSIPGEESPHADLNRAFKDLTHLLENVTRFYLNSVTLSGYWRKGFNSQGLKIKKFLGYGGEDKDFRDRWEAILNKCSPDLMLLLTEETEKKYLRW